MVIRQSDNLTNILLGLMKKSSHLSIDSKMICLDFAHLASFIKNLYGVRDKDNKKIKDNKHIKHTIPES